ncbi:MAG: AAA family ATPase [Gammaproteobacteria bacterium]|nr:AAA family ATPase [Gammaproteobacteria bacterium]
MSQFPKLIDSLKRAPSLTCGEGEAQIVETHISYILLTDRFAYKIKKSVDLGFLDFTTLEKRRFYCEEELRLNRRLAPDLYLDIVAINGTEEQPIIDGAGAILEYAVKMRRFDRSKELDRLVSGEDISKKHIDQLAADIAEFHDQADVADPQSRFSDLSGLHNRVTQNFDQVAKCAQCLDGSSTLERLQQWTDKSLSVHAHDFENRKRYGFVRECHGDLHLGNMFLQGDRVTLFDCLEFSEDLRWIDVMSDMAFLVMDLDYRERDDLSRRLLNRYLEHSGDYAGLRILPHYLVYRAMVRAKVACIRLQQSGVDVAQQSVLAQEVRDHLGLATRYAEGHGNTPLIVMHGVSGTGKSYLSEVLFEQVDAIRIRSDVERKRLFGRQGAEQLQDGLDEGIYAPQGTYKTYHRLLELAKVIIQSGYPVIVDATFLKHSRRAMFHELAKQLDVPFRILDLRASQAVLRERVMTRLETGADPSDADLAVLEHQCRTKDPFVADELPCAISVDTDEDIDMELLLRSLGLM